MPFPNPALAPALALATVLLAPLFAQGPLPPLPVQLLEAPAPSRGLRVEVVDAVTNTAIPGASFAWVARQVDDAGAFLLPRGKHWYEAAAEGYHTRREAWEATSKEPAGVLRVPLLPRVLLIRGTLDVQLPCRVTTAAAAALPPLCPASVAVTGGWFELVVRDLGEQTVDLTFEVLGRSVLLAVPTASRRRIDVLPHKAVPVVEPALELQPTERERSVETWLHRRRSAGLPQAWRQAVDLALAWLAAHQDADGRWDADGFMEHDRPGDACDGPGDALVDVGVTGLALLALLGAGHSPLDAVLEGSSAARPGYGAQVRRGVAWLLQQRSEDNVLHPTEEKTASGSFFHQHCIATIALCEAWAAGGDESWRPLIQGAVDYVETHRNPYSCWSYEQQSGENRMTATMWATLALLAAREAGFTVNVRALELVSAYVDDMTDDAGRTGYIEKGGRSGRRVGEHLTDFPVDRFETMTAAGVLLRLRLGQDRKRMPILGKSIQLLGRLPPAWEKNAKGSSLDFFGWSLGTQAMCLAGGWEWSSWSKAVTEAVVKHQRVDGNFRGSWDPVDAWGAEGGRVYATAMLALALLSPARR
jgi:hypothetical protein